MHKERNFISFRLTSGLILASHRTEALRDLLQLNFMALTMTDNDGLNQTVYVL